MCLKDNCQGFQKTPLEIMPGVSLPIFFMPKLKSFGIAPTSPIFHITPFFLVKTYKRDQWNLPNILAYISGIFDGFFKAGLVPLR